jgi:methyl-accepting chemotaxis protein
MENTNQMTKGLFGRVRIRTKIIAPTILVLVISNLISVFTSAYRMDDLAKNNAKMALNQLTDSIFLNLRTAMNTGDIEVIKDAEQKARDSIPGLKKFVVAKNDKVIELFVPLEKKITNKDILEVMNTKKDKLIEKNQNGHHTIRSLKPMIAKKECLYCHVNENVGDVIGVLDLTFDLKESDFIINSTVNNLVVQAIAVLILVTLFMTWLIRRATMPIEAFQKGLEMFFRYIKKEKNDIAHIDQYSNDEIGELVESVNKNIDATVKGVQKDEAVISEAKEVIEKASVGIYDVQIKSQAHSAELEDLRNLVNKLIDAIGYNLNRVLNVLNDYDQNNYISRINSKGNTVGTMKEVFQKVDALGDSLAKSSKTNLQNGQSLQQDAQHLEESVTTVQDLLKKQSAQLENSVEQLSQITSAIDQTAKDATSMAQYAQNVTKAVSVGQELATQTTSEMQEIFQQVNSINEAINIIDEIAFQTNILSLNAAIEAATAGEAGKGFAVVAQEVRNLANRSAEAAKEIKDLVEKATTKANSGQEISENMTQGYEELNNHINSTIDLIQNVTKAAHHQQSSIVQINDNINQINQQTIKSTNMIQNVQTIAIETNKIASEILDEAQEKKF